MSTRYLAKLSTALILLFVALQTGNASTAILSPESQIICKGGYPVTITMTEDATSRITYQVSTNKSTWTDIHSGSSDIVRIGETVRLNLSIAQTTYFRFYFTPSGTTKIYSNIHTIYIADVQSAGTIGDDETILTQDIPDNIIELTPPVITNTTNYLYSWEKSIDNGVSWIIITGNTEKTYQPGALSQTTYYRRGVCSVECSDIYYSNYIIKTVRLPQITAGVIGTAQTVCYNAKPNTLQAIEPATCEKGNITYRWQISSNGSTWTDISGAISGTYSPEASTVNKYYRRIASSQYGTSANSNAILITVRGDLTPGSVTSAQTICYNTTPSELSGSTPTGGAGHYTYQWQQGPLDGSTWSDISGATTQNYQPPALTASKSYRRKVTDDCGTVYSNSVKIQVYSELTAGTAKKDMQICYNTIPPLFTSTSPTGGSGNYSYRWQSHAEGSTYWGNSYNGATENFQYAYAMILPRYYRRAVTDAACGTVYSNEILIGVNSPLGGGGISPATQTICYNSTPSTLTGTTATGGAGNYTYLWQSSTDKSSWSSITGATQTSYTPQKQTQTTYYRRQVTDNCGTIYSNIATINVLEELAGGTIGSDQVIVYNTAPSQLNGTVASGGSGNYSYQWQHSTNGSSWSDITGKTTQNYAPSALTSSRYFRRKVTDDCGTAYTNIVLITVQGQLNGGSITPTAQTICYNTAPSQLNGTSPSGGSGSYSYVWQYYSSGSWVDISNTNTLNYQPPKLTESKTYRRKVNDNSVEAYSKSITITVLEEFTPGSINGDQEIINGTVPAAISVVSLPTGGQKNYAYQWYQTTDFINWELIEGANSANYQPKALTKTTRYKRATIDNCGVLYTNEIKIDVVDPNTTAGVIGYDEDICYNTTPSLIEGTEATSQDGIVYYQWEVSTDAVNWSIIVNATSQNYQPPALIQTKLYRRKAYNNFNFAYSNVVQTTVRKELAAGTIGSDELICYNTYPSQINGTTPSGGSGDYQYQWQYNSSGNWIDITGAYSQNYQPPLLKSTRVYRRKVADECGVVYSNLVTISVKDELKAGSITSSQTVCYNTAPTELTGTTPSGGSGDYQYQWQQSSNGSSWSNIIGETQTDYSPANLTSSTYYRRKVTDGCGIVTSNSVLITVRSELNPGMVSSDLTICNNSVPSAISATNATGGSGSYQYQWQSLVSGIWNNIIGATSQNYQPPAMTSDINYRREVKDICGTAYTTFVHITVLPTLKVDFVSGDQFVCYNGTPEILSCSGISGGNSPYSMQWIKSTDEGKTWTSIPGANSTSYQAEKLTTTTQYRVIITDQCQESITSNIIKINVYDDISSGNISGTQDLCYNTIPGILSTTAATGGNNKYQYQWQYSRNNAIWYEINGANAMYYQPEALTENRYFRIVSKNDCKDVASNPILITVLEEMNPGTIGNDQTILFGTAPDILNVSSEAEGASNSFKYQWQKSVNQQTWINIDGATNVSYQPLALNETTYYRRKTTDNLCGTLTTNTVTITVTTKEELIGTIANDQTICYQSIPAMLIPVNEPNTTSYTYQWEASGDGSNWSDLPGATETYYQPVALTQTTYYRKKVEIKSGQEISTNIVTITVLPEFTPGQIGPDQDVCVGIVPEPITNVMNPSAGSVQNRWEYSGNGSTWTTMTGETSDYLVLSPLTTTTYFRKIVTGQCGTLPTNSIKITVYPVLTGGLITENQTIPYNAVPEPLKGTSPTGGTGVYEYIWQRSQNQTDWNDIPGANQENYQPGTLNSTTSYRRKISGENCGEVYSNSITITVLPELLPGIIGNNQSICYGMNANELSGTEASGSIGVYSYQWQVSDDKSSWSDLLKADDPEYTPTSVKGKTYYRRGVTSGESVAYSNVVTINTTSEVIAPQTNEKQLYCKGESAVISITNAQYPVYKWYDTNNSLIQNGEKLNLSAINQSTSYRVEAIDNNGCVSSATLITIHVDPVKADFNQDVSRVTIGNPVHFINKSTNGATYIWNFFEGDQIFETSPYHYYNVAGQYDVELTVTSPNQCQDKKTVKNAVTATLYTGLDDHDYLPVTLKENPVTDEIAIESEADIERMMIYSATGSLVKTVDHDRSMLVSKLNRGIYLLVVTTTDHRTKQFKVVKK